MVDPIMDDLFDQSVEAGDRDLDVVHEAPDAKPTPEASAAPPTFEDDEDIDLGEQEK